MTTDSTAHPAPTPAPVAVPEGGWRDGDEVVQILSQGFQVGARDDGVWRFSTAATAADYTDEDVDWMVESGRVAAVHLAPRPEPVAAPLLSEALRRLAERGVGTDLNPTTSPSVDVGWWYEYLRALDGRWRGEVTRIADRLVPEDDEDTVRVPRRFDYLMDPRTPQELMGALTESTFEIAALREKVGRVETLRERWTQDGVPVYESGDADRALFELDAALDGDDR